MAKPKRGDVWLVDMDYTAKVRPALVLNVQIEGNERELSTVVPHTTSARGTRFEFATTISWLKAGAFDAQGIGTYPTVKLVKRLGTLPNDQLNAVEDCLLKWLGIAEKDTSG